MPISACVKPEEGQLLSGLTGLGFQGVQTPATQRAGGRQKRSPPQAAASSTSVPGTHAKSVAAAARELDAVSKQTSLEVQSALAVALKSS